jgi:4'-phosphopantetheinyl transferase
LMALPEPERPQAFFNCWTRKEAYIKAVGDGLSVPLDSFRVTLGPGVPAEILCLGGSIEAAKGWTMHHFDPAPGFVGAIAYPGCSREILFNRLVTVDELLALL